MEYSEKISFIKAKIDEIDVAVDKNKAACEIAEILIDIFDISAIDQVLTVIDSNDFKLISKYLYIEWDSIPAIIPEALLPFAVMRFIITKSYYGFCHKPEHRQLCLRFFDYIARIHRSGILN